MEDFLFTPIVLAVGLAIHAAVRRDVDPRIKSLLDLSIGMHVLSGFAVIWVYQFYYGGGDIFGYHRAGVLLAEVLRYDFELIPEYVRAVLQLPFHIPIDDYSGSNSTTTVQFISAFLHFVCGDSLYAVVTVIAFGSGYSKYLMFRAFEREIPSGLQRSVFSALMLMPSAVFWTSSLLKEPLVMVALGPAIWGFVELVKNARPVVGLAASLPAVLAILLLKPYVLLCLGLSLSLWLIWSKVVAKRGPTLSKPVYFFVGVLTIPGIVLGISAAVPQLNVSQMGESMTKFRQGNALEEGGSTYYLDDPDAVLSANAEEASTVSQFRLALPALFTALFRPTLLEARNPMLLANALETTWLAFITIAIIRRRRTATEAIFSSPFLVFCLSFTLLLGLGTGLASSNLGSLSRYRAPMIPFFAAALLFLKRKNDELYAAKVGQQPHRLSGLASARG